MKKIAALTILLMVPLFLMAQNTAIDKLFDKYGGQDGFTTVYISQELFKFISDMESEEIELDKPLENITGVKILVQEEEDAVPGLNFYEELKSDMNFSEYKELVVVKEKDQDVWILAKETNGKMSELLIVVGGEDNVLVSIEGSFTFEELSELSKIEGLDHLDLLDHNHDCDDDDEDDDDEDEDI